MPFRQESNFYYLSGCAVPSSFLLLSSAPSATGYTLQSYLFVTKADAEDLLWSAAPPSAEEAKGLYDVDTVDYVPALEKTLDGLLTLYPNALVHTLPKDSPLFPTLPPQYADHVLAASKAGVVDAAITDAFILTAVHRARLVKTPEEIALMRHAAAISSRAHEVVMRVLGLGVKQKIKKVEAEGLGRPLLPGEWLIEKEAEAEALFVASCRREG